MQSGSGEPGRAGLARFRSAPATWLEALLEDEEEDPLKQNQCLTQLLSAPPPLARTSVGFTSSSSPAASVSASAVATPSSSGFLGGGFLRQNSSPADFLGSSGLDLDGYFSNYGNLDYMSANDDASPSSKRQRDAQSQQISSRKYPSHQLKLEESSFLDLETDGLLEESGSFRVRAKRGCATHPRSIAERVRRTRISDRIRKLQELVPNMDKQTNTADMLDEAVEYVKLLQKQIQELSEQQKNCICTPRE